MAGVLDSGPDHPGLLLRTEAKPFIKPRRARTEPEQFDGLETRMMKYVLHEVGADVSTLIGLIDNDVPNRRTKDIIGQHSSKRNEPLTVPRRHDKVCMSQHLPCLVGRSALRPGSLLIETNELRGVDIVAVRERNSALYALEGRRHLVLN
jgi:hypothetical protein